MQNKCKCQITGQRQRPRERNFGGRSLYIAHGSFETQSENSDHLRHSHVIV